MFYEKRDIFMDIFDKLGMIPNNESLYVDCFKHSSYANENGGADYEKLEFLGDAVLELAISDYLYKKEFDEGIMTKTRASYVCENALAVYASDLGFDKYILLGSGEITPNNTIMADVFEAFLGSMYLDKGYDFTKDIILSIIVPYINRNADFLKDYKSELQELVQTERKSAVYNTISESGPAHDKNYVCEVVVDDIRMGTGSGSSKKQAEQNAAKEALSKQAKI